MNRKSLKIDCAGDTAELRIAFDANSAQVESDRHEGVLEVTRSAVGELSADTEVGRRRLFWARDGDDVFVTVDGRSFRLNRHHAEHGAAGGTGADDDATHATMTAPMVGRVVKLNKAEGDTVEEGETVVVVEAMKMEHPLLAPFDGSVEQISCEEGQPVDMGDLLARLVRAE